MEIRDAATVLVLRDQPNFEVLMVQRTPTAVFAPSVWVFPGGRVEADDAEVQSWNTRIRGLTDAAASRQLDVPEHGLAWWIAGVRETIEEAGLLLGADSAQATEATEIADAIRNEPSASLDKLLDAGALTLALGDIVEVARFITPPGPPRRYDTRFLVAPAPPDQDVTVDGEEIVDAAWITPDEALTLWSADSFSLMGVTHRMLACLRRYRSVADVIDLARSRPEPRRVRVNDPDGAYEVLLPEDPGYDTAELEIEHGWVRL